MNAPDFLSGNAREEWERLAEERGELLKDPITQRVLAGYCQAFGRWKQAEKDLAESGFLIKTTSGNVVESPLVSIANGALKLMQLSLEKLMAAEAKAKREARLMQTW